MDLEQFIATRKDAVLEDTDAEPTRFRQPGEDPQPEAPPESLQIPGQLPAGSYSMADARRIFSQHRHKVPSAGITLSGLIVRSDLSGGGVMPTVGEARATAIAYARVAATFSLNLRRSIDAIIATRKPGEDPLLDDLMAAIRTSTMMLDMLGMAAVDLRDALAEGDTNSA